MAEYAAFSALSLEILGLVNEACQIVRKVRQSYDQDRETEELKRDNGDFSNVNDGFKRCYNIL